MQTETLFKIKLLPILKKIPNSWVYKTSDVCKSGIPDILMCVNGFFVALELKTDTGKLSKIQKITISKIGTNAKGIALVVTPSNYKAVVQYLTIATSKSAADLILEDVSLI